jgi:hypothetical protein
MDVASWVTLPFAGERLASVVHMGNGKDADLLLTFADGRRVMLPVSAMRVEAGQGIVVDVSRWDDVSMRIEYLGSDLYLHSGRFGYPGDYDQFVAEFPAAAQSWLAAGCEEELLWVVEVELCLATRPPDSSDAA